MLALLPAVNVSIVSAMHAKLGVMVHRGDDNVQTHDQRGSKAREPVSASSPFRGEGTVSLHPIRTPLLVLTPLNKKLFLRWALEGFKLRKLPTRRSASSVAAKFG